MSNLRPLACNAALKWPTDVRRLNVDALIYSLVWAALAVIGWRLAGLRVGILLSVGLFLIVMPASVIILSRTGNFALERGIRWGILAIAALALFSFADLNQAPAYPA